MAKFLIIRFSSIGDIVLTTPVIRCLKKQVPGAEVHYLGKETFRSVLESNPYIDKLHLLTNDWKLMMDELVKENFDFIIDLHHNLRSLRVKNKLKKKSFAFNKLNIEKYIFTRLRINMLPEVHIVDRYMKTIESFGVINDGDGLDFFIPKNELIQKNDIPVLHQSGFIACVIGAGHGTKKLPIHKWKQFCLQQELPLILLGGVEDIMDGNSIASVDPVKVFNGCGKFSIAGSADIIRKSLVVVSNDTGLMHIAAAFNKPVISLWGNTVPAFGMYPYYGKNFLESKTQPVYDIIETKKLWCRPCSKIGYKKCPLGHFNCMEKIQVDSMTVSVRKQLLNFRVQ